MATWQMIEAPKVRGGKQNVTEWSCKLYALDAAIAAVRRAGFPPDITDYYDWTHVTADPRCGNTEGARLTSRSKNCTNP